MMDNQTKQMSISDRNAWLLNIFALCQGTIFVLPVLLPYYRDEIGLGFWQLMFGEAVFSAVILACEVPTGWLADHWKRKYVLALSGVVGMIGYGLLWAAHSFVTTVIAQGIIGVGVSLVSGTMQALHYDTLLSEGRTAEYRRQEGKRHSMGLLAVGLSSLSGGFLYKLGHDLPVIGTILSDIGMIAAALLMIEPERQKTAQARNPFVTMAQTLKYALHGHREVAEIIFSAAALFGTTKMLMWAQQAYYASVHLDEAWYGVLMACGFLGGALASQLGHRLDHRFRSRTVLLAMTMAVVGICAASAALHSLAGAVLLIAGSLFWGLGWPRVQDAINACVGSERRATVLSSCNLMINVVFMPLSLVVGRVSAVYGPETAVLALAVLPALASLVLLRLVWRGREAANALI